MLRTTDRTQSAPREPRVRRLGPSTLAGVRRMHGPRLGGARRSRSESSPTGSSEALGRAGPSAGARCGGALLRSQRTGRDPGRAGRVADRDHGGVSPAGPHARPSAPRSPATRSPGVGAALALVFFGIRAVPVLLPDSSDAGVRVHRAVPAANPGRAARLASPTESRARGSVAFPGAGRLRTVARVILPLVVRGSRPAPRSSSLPR